MIITDEELLALLNSEDPGLAGFRPIALYALDCASYEMAKQATLPNYVALHRTQPDACWQWEGLFSAGAIALYDPDSHRTADYFPQLQLHNGIYAIEEDWQGGCSQAIRRGATGLLPAGSCCWKITRFRGCSCSKPSPDWG